MSTQFSPLFMPARQTEKTARPVTITADLVDDKPAGLVRPGLREEVEVGVHDGIIKAKQAKKGMKVRAYLHGKACGGERIVEDVERIEDGAKVRISFSSPHPTTDYKAAYRFHVEALEGTEVRTVTKVAALVPYEEV